MLSTANSVVASCDVSHLSEMSSCTLSNKATVQAKVSAKATVMSSTEWDSRCTCVRTGRRPSFKIDVPEVVRPLAGGLV